MNYLCIDDEIIKLSDDLIKKIKSEINKQRVLDEQYVKFTDIINGVTDIGNSRQTKVQIGKNSVPVNMRGKCLVVRNDVDIIIEDNKDNCHLYTKRILFKIIK